MLVAVIGFGHPPALTLSINYWTPRLSHLSSYVTLTRDCGFVLRAKKAS